MGSHHPIRKSVAPEPPQIPDKLYFRIGDVARLCAVPAYVLRFWESEFPQLKPNKGGTGQRLYRRKDVEMALRIKSLLYDQGYTIAGARQVFKSEAARSETPEDAVAAAPVPLAPAPMAAPAVDLGEHIRERAQRQHRLRELRSEMASLLDLLGGPVSAPKSPDTSPRRPLLMPGSKPALKADTRLRLEKRDEKAEEQRALFLFDTADPIEPGTPAETAE